MAEELDMNKANVQGGNAAAAAPAKCACGHDHDHEHEHHHDHDHEPGGFCPCGHDAVSGGVGHDRAMGRIFFALLGGILTVNSFLLEWALPEQAFAASISALFGAFVLALPMLYIFGCGLYTLYCREWLQFLILLVAEFGCFALIFMGALIADAAEHFSGWVAGL